MAAENERRLMKNHLAFLASHRGKVSEAHDATLVESDRAEFTYVIPEEGGELGNWANRFKTIHLAPWSGDRAAEIDRMRLSKAGAFTYMTLEGDPASWATNDRITVKAVKTEADMDVFSEIQARAFAEDQSVYESWHPWLRAANHRNLKNRKQIFYVGFFDEKPVGTTLTVFDGDTAGFYAVATLPEHRRKGVSQSMMATAISDAYDLRYELLTLQVSQGSYAEKLYHKLGFRTKFVNPIYSLPVIASQGELKLPLSEAIP